MRRVHASSECVPPLAGTMAAQTTRPPDRRLRRPVLCRGERRSQNVRPFFAIRNKDQVSRRVIANGVLRKKRLRIRAGGRGRAGSLFCSFALGERSGEFVL